jgi:hypothetical protein
MGRARLESKVLRVRTRLSGMFTAWGLIRLKAKYRGFTPAAFEDVTPRGLIRLKVKYRGFTPAAFERFRKQSRGDLASKKLSRSSS